MIKYEGMKAEESSGGNNMGQLPVGAYVGYCSGARIDGKAPDQSLILALDVLEGKYKDFYHKKFNAAKESGSKYGDPKYKGTFRLRIPNPDNPNAQYPELDKRQMNDMIFRFEQSNPGFHWDGDENKLRGLSIGFSTQEDSYNGNTFTRIGRLESVDAVKAGTVTPMRPRRRKGADAGTDPMSLPPSQVPTDPISGLPIVEDEPLPF